MSDAAVAFDHGSFCLLRVVQVENETVKNKHTKTEYDSHRL